MAEQIYNFRYISLSNRLDKSSIRYSSKADTWVTVILTLLFALLLTSILFIRIYCSTAIVQKGYEITSLTKEKIRLLEEQNRLNAEIAFLKSSHNLKGLSSEKMKLGLPGPNRILNAGQ